MPLPYGFRRSLRTLRRSIGFMALAELLGVGTFIAADDQAPATTRGDLTGTASVIDGDTLDIRGQRAWLQAAILHQGSRAAAHRNLRGRQM